jgi:hypothetical protein
MNLADAIRMASQQRFQSAAEPRLADPPPTPALPHGEESDSIQTVRFEVRLTTQQLHDLLQWLARNLHPVMTLREAARYLRLHTAELEALAAVRRHPRVQGGQQVALSESRAGRVDAGAARRRISRCREEEPACRVRHRVRRVRARRPRLCWR